MADRLPPSDEVAVSTEECAVSDPTNASPVNSNPRAADATSDTGNGAGDRAGNQESNSNIVKPSVEQLISQGAVISAQHKLVLQNQYGVQLAVLPISNELHQMQQYQAASIAGSATMTGSTASCIVATGGTLTAQPLVLSPLPPAAHFFMPNGSAAQSFLTLAQPQSQGTSVLQLNSSAVTPTLHQHTTCVLTSSNGQAQAIISPQQHAGGNSRQAALTNSSVAGTIAGMQVLHQSPADDVPDLEELERFAKHFKRRRIELGFTQGDVGTAMGKIYSNDFSQTTISRFEALNLSFKNMCKLKPLLEKWLQEVDPEDNSGDKIGQQQQNHVTSDGTVSVPNMAVPAVKHDLHRRRKRTNIDNFARSNLERSFISNPKPSSEEIAAIAESLRMESTVVRIWFCNRRQKERRINPSSPPNNAFVLMNSAPQISLQGYVQAVPVSTANGLENLNANSLNAMHQNALQSGQGQELLSQNAILQPNRLLHAGPLSSGVVSSVDDNRLQQQSHLPDVHVLKDNLCSPSSPSPPGLPAIASMAALSTDCYGDLRSPEQQQQHQFLTLQQRQAEQGASQQASTRESGLSQDSAAHGATASGPAGPMVTS